jgi:hypothetical protein
MLCCGATVDHLGLLPLMLWCGATVDHLGLLPLMLWCGATVDHLGLLPLMLWCGATVDHRLLPLMLWCGATVDHLGLLPLMLWCGATVDHLGLLPLMFHTSRSCHRGTTPSKLYPHLGRANRWMDVWHILCFSRILSVSLSFGWVAKITSPWLLSKHMNWLDMCAPRGENVGEMVHSVPMVRTEHDCIAVEDVGREVSDTVYVWL